MARLFYADESGPCNLKFSRIASFQTPKHVQHVVISWGQLALLAVLTFTNIQ
jgi:hypothetical protein